MRARLAARRLFIRGVFALVNESFREAAAKLRMGILGVVRVVAVLLAGAEDALRP
jgi:hypothetical protein